MIRIIVRSITSRSTTNRCIIITRCITSRYITEIIAKKIKKPVRDGLPGKEFLLCRTL